jgi:hypothetical protein
MIPAVLNLSFELGVIGEADFTVSEDLIITAAKAGFRKDRGEVLTFTVDCVIEGGLVIKLRVPTAQLEQLGIGRHAYQLDVLADGEPLRLVKGIVSVAYAPDLFP